MLQSALRDAGSQFLMDDDGQSVAVRWLAPAQLLGGCAIPAQVFGGIAPLSYPLLPPAQASRCLRHRKVPSPSVPLMTQP